MVIHVLSRRRSNGSFRCCFSTIVLFLFLCCNSSFTAGHRSCGTHDLSPVEEKDSSIVMQKWRAKKISRQQQKQQEPKFQIDTYFHVIQRDNGSPVLEDDLLMEQFDVLNEVYKETPFQFDLKDITRTQRSEWVDDTSGRDDELEGIIGLALRQGGPDTMNIYIQPGLCDADLFGYASLPRWRGIFPVNKYSPHDHVNICNDYLPGRSFPFDLGYTLVHEVGHWLGTCFIQLNCVDSKSLLEPCQLTLLL